MKNVKHVGILAGLLCLGAALVACGDDKDKNEETDAGAPDAGSTDSMSTDTGTGTGTGPAEPVKPNPAIDENFDAWVGGGESFFMSKPEEETSILEGNNTAANIAGHDCAVYHALSADNYGFGTAIEAQFQLVAQDVDMSGEDYEISFDIYLNQAMKDKNVNIQFAFFQTDGYTPIYSILYDDEIAADTWVTITAPIRNDPAFISYSGFDTSVDPNANPGSWQFDVVRIQAVIPEAEENADAGADAGEDASAPSDPAADGQEILFYLDNLVVRLAETAK